MLPGYRNTNRSHSVFGITPIFGEPKVTPLDIYLRTRKPHSAPASLADVRNLASESPRSDSHKTWETGSYTSSCPSDFRPLPSARHQPFGRVPRTFQSGVLGQSSRDTLLQQRVSKVVTKDTSLSDALKVNRTVRGAAKTAKKQTAVMYRDGSTAFGMSSFEAEASRRHVLQEKGLNDFLKAARKQASTTLVAPRMIYMARQEAASAA